MCLLASLACMASASGAKAGGAGQGETPDAFPYELAFTANEFPYNENPVASPSGDRVAYVVIAPPATQPQDDRFLPSGTPTTAIGASLHIASADARSASASIAVCAGKGNQWAPAWSRDGRQLAFYSDADGRVQPWVYGLDSGACRRVSDAVVRGSVFSGSEPRWSPDGGTLYVPLDPNPPTAESGIANSNAAVTAADDGKSKAIVHFGGGEAGEVAGETTRSGSSQAFMLRHYNTTLAAISLQDGRSRVLVPAENETRPNRLELSPSGRWVSYMSVIHPKEEISTEYVTDLQVVPSAGGTPRVLAKGLQSSEHNVNYTRLDYRWHPTRDRLFYLKEGGLWSVDFTDDGAGTPRRLAEELGELAPAVLYFTADGKDLLVGLDPKGLGRDRAPQGLALVSLSAGTVKRLGLPSEKEWQFLDLVRANENVLWQPDPGSLSVVLRERGTGEQAVMRLDIGSDKRSTLAKGMHRTSGFVSGGDHGNLFAIYEDIATPPNLYRFSASVARGQKLSIIDPRLEGRRYGSAEVIETRTPQHDGSMASVRTTLLLPPGAKKGDRLPGIVMIYSGSDLSTRASYFGGGMGNTVPSQVFTSRGYAVIMANIVLAPEGVPSHPAERMTDEVLAQAYAVADAGYVDINRLAVSGQSYGGYSTASIVSHTNLFRAGIPVNGTFDLASFYGGMDDAGDSHWIRWAEKGQGRMGETPWANPQRFIDNSPFYRIDRIHTPLLIVAGEKDGTVPYEESKKLFVGLRRLERPVQLAIYPGEGHVISTWSTKNAVDASRRMVEFLDKHLRAPGIR
ncbi:S9 family peptidase [Pseudoxanthomonas yeongjuensis]|uniref:S9 family peptidase n=1 Tax=Pseudoxanthomonas yeongjuensis TaxID=377616 RepID=UPI0013913BE2|nr:prolyl oligopeptidase family serine peptidase [Pseudoxanthomonas yeongjuensis]